MADHQYNENSGYGRKIEQVKTGQGSRYDLINKNFIFPQDKFAAESSYANDYLGKVYTQQAQIKPEGQLKVGGSKFQAGSSYNLDFELKQNEPRREKIVLKDNQVMPKGNFQGNSTYQGTYLGENVERSKYIKPEGELRVGGNKFEGASSYGKDYEQRENQQRREKIIFKDNQIMPKGNFEGNSTYQGIYTGEGTERSRLIKRDGELKIGGNFQGNSSYARDFEQKQNQLRRQKIVGKDNQIMPRGDFEGNSTYARNYIGESSEKSKQIKPQSELKVGGQFYGESNYSGNYYDKGAQPRLEKYKQSDHQIMPEGKFQESSTYINAYIPSIAQRNQLIKKEGQLKVGGKFEGISSYADQFEQRLSQQRREKIVGKDNQIMPIGLFLGNSTYQNTYAGENSQRSKLIIPEGELKIGGQFYGESHYTGNYYDKGSPPKAEKFKSSDHQIMPEGRFQELSTYSGAYIPSKIQRNPQIKPEGQLKVGGNNFQGNSSYSDQYTGQSAPRRQKITIPQNDVMPKGNFVGNSTYGGDYLQSYGERGVAMKPEGQLKVGEGKFEGDSSYSKDYESKGNYRRAEKIVPSGNSVMPEGRFEGTSTSQAHHTTLELVRNLPMRPKQEIEMSGNPFEGRSTYEETYRNR